MRIPKLVRRLPMSMKNTGTEKTYTTQERYIRNHPRKDVIIASLREGIACSEIARWFAESGWIDITQKSFEQYLLTFRRLNPDIIYGKDNNSIDDLMDAHKPNANVKTELMRLYRLQKVRIKIDVMNEQEINKLFNTTHKEIEAARLLLETIAKIDGDIGTANQPSGKVDDLADAQARDALRNVVSDEGQRDRMTSLVANLVKSISNDHQKVRQTA